MKEASGEANLTVITIILIGVVLAIATPLITTMMKGTAKKSCCQSYGGSWESNKCYVTNAAGTRSQVAESNFWDATNNKCKVG